MLCSFDSRKMQPLAALRVICAEADDPVQAATPTPPSTPAIKPIFPKLPPAEAITQVSGQPDRARVPNCCRSTCLDYVTIQSLAYVTRQENASTDSNYRV